MAQHDGVVIQPAGTPPPDERDRVLGKFVHQWDALDAHVKLVFGALLGTPHEISKIVLGLSRETNRLREMLLRLGKVRLSDRELTTLDRLCGRYDSIATRRNRIVHGQWYAIGSPNFRGDPAYGMKWVRFYDPIDQEIFWMIMQPDKGGRDHARARARFTFDLPRISELTEVCRNITIDWNEFSNSLRTRAFPPRGQAPQLWPKLPDA